MALSCGTKCIKYILLIFNTLVFILGCIITGFGIYFVVEAEKDLNGQAVGVPAFVLTLGLLVFLLGFLGCCGAWKENVCLLRTFGAIIIILLICEIVAGILVFVYRAKFVTLVADGIANQISELNTMSQTQQEDTRKAIDTLQENLECCGGHNASDWGKDVPSSCCKGQPKKCDSPYKQGCAQAMYEFVKDKALGVGITLVIMAVLELGAIISALCLAKKIGEYEKV
uniref:Tetraspanin n=1 Tax=Schistocephalus solidus TaxID=70667 RepID=A0A0V0JA15_SCHSO